MGKEGHEETSRRVFLMGGVALLSHTHTPNMKCSIMKLGSKRQFTQNHFLIPKKNTKVDSLIPLAMS